MGRYTIAGAALAFFFVFLGTFKQFWVTPLQGLPLANLLVEAEITSRPRPPFVVLRQPKSAALEEVSNVIDPKPDILEWIDRLDVLFGA